MATETLHELLTIKDGVIRVGSEFSATLAQIEGKEQVRQWGATFGNFVTQLMDIREINELDQVFEVANGAFTEAREEPEFDDAVLETFLEGVLHGGIVALDPNRVIAGGITA